MLQLWTAAVFAIIIAAIAFLIFWLGPMPGNIARKRGHPQAEMLMAMGWMGLFFSGGVAWLIAFIWAYGKPAATAAALAEGAKAGAEGVSAPSETQQALADALSRVQVLEARLAERGGPEA